MGFYFGIFGVLAFFSFFEIFGLKERQRNIMFLIFSFFIFCLSFLRWEVGTDWGTYFNFFNSSNDWFLESEFEWGFSRINEFVKILFDDYSVLLFTLGAILFSFQTSAIYKLSPYPITSLLFLWSVLFGNAMFIRQYISTAILLFSVSFIISRNFWKFALCIALAMLFHRTSIIFLPAWWLYRLKIQSLWLWIGIGFSIVMTAGVKSIFESIAGSFGPIVQAKMDVYLSDGETTFGAASSLVEIIVKGVANKVILFTWFIFMLKAGIEKYGEKFRGLVNLYWFGILIYFSTIGISVAMVRFSFAYDILQIILMAMTFPLIKNRTTKLIVFFLFLSYLAARHYIAIVGSYYELFVPYKTIFE